MNRASSTYSEDFHSVFRDAVNWFWVMAGISFAVFILGIIFTKGAGSTEEILQPFFFAGFGCIVAAIYFKTTLENGQIEVTTKQLTIIQDGREETFTKSDLAFIARAKLAKSRHFWMARFQDQNGEATSKICRIKPHHVSWWSTTEGVVLIAPMSDRPIFIPTKNPDLLLQALKSMK